MNTETFPSFAGYQFTELTYNGCRTLVYRAIQTVNHQPVIIKFLRSQYPTFSELVQFRNQYAIARNLDIAGIVRPISLEPWKNGYALIMEDCGSISLQQYIKHQPLQIEDVLNIAVQLAQILHELHQNRVIHKDIKPANVLIHPETQKVKLIDFSISSLLPKETQEIQNPNILEGTLAYISPEQTGRMNRGIDYRTDFYSLGITLFELLTEKLPFKSNDPMELVHCHIAKSPIFPDTLQPQESGDKPDTLQKIVLKLMAKNAEERYQSALGLKYDLEKCLSQYSQTQDIERFELGKRDICDRFNIPEKLYGREQEVTQLLAAFERVANGNSEMMLVAGCSGIGKTAVINEVHKPIVRQRGYFIKGKFDQFNRNIPFSAFVQAFRDLMGQFLSESDIQLKTWKDKILEALGDQAQVLIDVIPELERIIGKQPAAAELSGSAAQNRFNLLFSKFVQVFTTKEHPLVLFLDDLQWADSASLNLLKLLTSESEVGYLLVLGAYRDHEVYPAHPLMLTLDEIEKQQAIINTITLEPLTQSGLNHLIADTLNCSLNLALPLTELIDKKTQGNPFFATQFIKGLYEDGEITFNLNIGYWQCDIVRVRQLSLTDDVVEFMAQQLQKLPSETQQVLKLAACIGNQFELATLVLVSEYSETEAATALWKALKEGLVLPINEVYKFYQSEENTESLSNIEEKSPSYKFLHDRVQQASYSLIPEDRREATHLKIGRLLLQNTLPQEREKKVFEIVNHLNQGISLLDDRVERNQLSELNLLAGCKAKISTAYKAAYDYFNVGIDLLDNCGWEENYNLTLQLYEFRAEVEYLNGDFEKSENDIRVIITKANNDIDRAKIYNLLVIQYTTMGQFSEAIQAGCKGLSLLGIDFPKENFNQAIEIEQAWIEKELETIKIADLVDALEIESDRQKVAVKLLASMQPTGYFYNPDIWALSVVKCVHLLIQYGYTDEAAFGYTNYGLFLTIALEKYITGYEFGCLGVELVDKFQNLPQKSQVYCPFGLCLNPWVKSSKISKNFAMQAYYAGLEAGNLQWAGYSLGYRLFMLFFNGNNLEELLKEVETCFIFSKKNQNQVVVDMAISCHVILSQLSDYSVKEMVYEIDFIRQSDTLDQSLSIPQYLILKSQLCYLQKQIEEALHYSLQAKESINLIQGNISVVEHNFYYSLILLALHHTKSEEEKQHDWQQLITNQKQMKKWADHCPENFMHRYLLVVAEMARLSDEKLKAIEMYDRAIAGAKEYKFLQNEALANELAAKFYLDWGKEKIAQTYMVEAYYCYARWGAKAKTDQLEATYPQLLASILQQPQSFLNFNSTIALTSYPTVRTSTNTTTSLLDLTTAIKASQALSGEIELEALLTQLMQIVQENAGADKSALILNNSGVWEVVAQCIQEDCQLSPIPLEKIDTLPLSIARKVQHTEKTIIINQVAQDKDFASDRYLIQQQPQSLFCTPILNQGRLIGILYLENKLSTEAFTTERVEVLNVLCSQAAISLENARLYRQSIDYATKLEGTVQELQQTQQQLQNSFEELQQAQLQLVQSEKMSALGNLVAGVAHEINNPLGFINGNITELFTSIQDITEYIHCYENTFPTPGEQIEKKREELDIEFILKDLPNMLEAMKVGCDRIGGISTSLRTFSRADTHCKFKANIHDGIDSTLLILKYRLKAKEIRPEIEIIRDYGNLPEINCFPGQLNQVFMNILANAIDMFDEMAQEQSYKILSAHPQQIIIRTHLIEQHTVEISISDNGKGMSEEVCSKIFDRKFTTKEVGKGTGLGLAIAHQIIAQKHNGSLKVNSQIGQGTEFVISLPI